MSIYSGLAEKRFNRLALVGVAFALSLLYELLAFEHWDGFGSFIFIVIFIGAAVLVAELFHILRQKWALLLLIPPVVLGVDTVIYNNDLVRGLAPLLIILFLILFSLVVTIVRPEGLQFRFRQIPIPRLFHGIANMFRDFMQSPKEMNRRTIMKVVIGLVLAVPLVIIFGALFAEADQIFADILDKLISFNINEELVGQVMRVLFVGLLFCGFFYTVINSGHILKSTMVTVRKFDSTIVITLLSVLNVLFLVFVFIQFKHLFGSYEYVLNNKIVFSDYARRGFFQLVWAAAFAFGLFLLMFRSFAEHGMHRVVKYMLLLFVGQTAVIAYSALHRMNLYQEAYGYTVQRLYAEGIIYVIMISLILGIVWLLTSWKFYRLFYAGCILVVSALMICMSLNVDYIIAHKNISRALDQDKPLDVSYLYSLSEDATPAIYGLTRSEKVFTLSEQEQADLGAFISYRKNNTNYSHSLLEFNWGRFNAKNIVDAL